MSKTVILDYGHGGSDPGACANGIVEKTANFVTGEACKAELAVYGVPVVVLRKSDVDMSLSERTRIANLQGTNSVYVSIHHNAGGGDRGECIYSVVADMGKSLANSIGDEMLNVLGQQKKIYNKVGDYNRDYYHVIRETVMPAVIVEVAFLDNATDVQICDTVDEQKRNGKVIAHGILKDLGISLKPGTSPAPSANLYRVRKSWADAASQKGAYSSLENAKVECNKHAGYSVYDKNGTAVYSKATAQPSGEYLNLKPHNAEWSVYNAGGPYTRPNRIGALAPARYGGLSYKIVGKPQTDVYLINTDTFGKCAIYVPKDNDSTFTGYAVY